MICVINADCKDSGSGNCSCVLDTLRLNCKKKKRSAYKLTYVSISSPSSSMSVNLSAAQDVDMFNSSFSAEQQRELAKGLTTFLSQYSHVSDSYIIVRTHDWLCTVCSLSSLKQLCQRSEFSCFLKQTLLAPEVSRTPKGRSTLTLADCVHLHTNHVPLWDWDTTICSRCLISFSCSSDSLK